MQKILFILSLLIISFSSSYAGKKGVTKPGIQERRTASLTGVTIERVMPDGWGKSIYGTVKVTDTDGKEVSSFITTMNLNETINIDVSAFATANYSLKVMVSHSKDTVTEINMSFFKKENYSSIALRFVEECVLNPPPKGQHPMMVDKPVIYLYPPQAEDISVKLAFKGNIAETIPDYNEGWLVNAKPDGTIKNYADGKEYPYLFWEGETYKQDWDMHSGFVVREDSIRQFLEMVLPKLGLIPKEYNEFIDFWLPRMQSKPYYLIHFAGKEYEDIAGLDITPKPDALLRVFMVFTPTYKDFKAMPQEFRSFIRKGFTVVEWGGTQLGKSNMRSNLAAYGE